MSRSSSSSRGAGPARPTRGRLVAFGLIPAVFEQSGRIAGGASRRAERAHPPHLCLPAQRLLAPPRQHGLPLGVRRQHRGCDGPCPLPRLLLPVRDRRRLRLRPLGARLAGPADRRLRGDRRHHRRLFHAPSLCQGLDPSPRPHSAAPQRALGARLLDRLSGLHGRRRGRRQQGRLVDACRRADYRRGPGSFPAPSRYRPLLALRSGRAGRCPGRAPPPEIDGPWSRR